MNKEAFTLFWNNYTIYSDQDASAKAYNKLILAAELWESSNDYIEAGYCYETIADICFHLDLEKKFNNTVKSINCYKEYLSLVTNDHIKNILSFYGVKAGLDSILRFAKDKNEVKRHQVFASEGLALYLQEEFKKHDYMSNFQVYGFNIIFNLLDLWTFEFELSASPGITKSNGSRISKRMPSAFDCFLTMPDYEAAKMIIIDFEDSFNTCGLKGWKNVVLAHTNEKESDKYFFQASKEFSKDTSENFKKELESGSKRTWNAANVTLWSNYFESRSYLSKILLGVGDVKENLINAADTLKDNTSGFITYPVLKYRAIISVFANIYDKDVGLSLQEGLKEYKTLCNIDGIDPSDENALLFLEYMTDYLNEISENPAKGLVNPKLTHAIELLGKIPYISEVNSKYQNLDVDIGKKIHNNIIGETSWIYRTIQNISDEGIFRKILLRLFQSSYPKHAQITHSAVEHGKDIIAIIKKDNKHILEMYQVKIGNMNTSSWREVKPQLEEIYEVEPPQFIIDKGIDDKSGILIFNGTIYPIVEQKISGWLNTKKNQNQHYILMDLDSIVNYVIDNKLISELRYTLKENEIDIIT